MDPAIHSSPEPRARPFTATSPSVRPGVTNAGQESAHCDRPSVAVAVSSAGAERARPIVRPTSAGRGSGTLPRQKPLSCRCWSLSWGRLDKDESGRKRDVEAMMRENFSEVLAWF